MAQSRQTSTAAELLGSRVRELRSKRGLSQQALAELVGIPQTHVSAIEVGIKFPNLMTVLRLAAALQCKPSATVSVFDHQDIESIMHRCGRTRNLIASESLPSEQTQEQTGWT